MTIELKDTVTLPSGKERSMFDFPLPGESWTRTPGQYPWDKPSMYNTPDEAMDFYVEKFKDNDIGKQLITLLDMGVPVSTIVDSTLLAGFSEGLYTPDVAVLIAEDLSLLIMYLAKSSGIKPKLTEANEDVNVQDAMHQLAKLETDKNDMEQEENSRFTKEDLMPAKPKKELPQGIMAKGRISNG